MRHEDFRAGVFAEIVRPETAQAIAMLGGQHPSLDEVRDACRRVRARVSPVAAYFGFLPDLADSLRYIDLSQPREGHATIDTADAESLCCFALWRSRGLPLYVKVLLPALRKRVRDGSPPSGLPLHPHLCDDD